MNNWISKLAIVALMLGAAAGVVACSDDDGDELTLEQYFAAVDTVDNESTEAIDAAFGSLPEDDPTVEQAQEAFDNFAAAIDKAVADLEDINPPSEVEDKHEAVTSALQGVSDAAEDVADAGADATSAEDFFAAAESGAFVAANDAFTTACMDLQQFGADNGITVDLGCDDDEASAEIEQAVRDAAAAWNAKDVETLSQHFTDAGLNSSFGGDEAAPREEILASLPEFIGDPQIEIREIEIEETEAGANAQVVWVFGKTLENKLFTLVEEDGVWKLDSEDTLLVTEVPAGTAIVNVDLNEFAFGFDASQVSSTAAIAFEGTNVGQQQHEMVLAKIPEDAVLEELLASEEDVPGWENIGYAGPLEPGATASLVIVEPLAPGRYVLVCYLPDAEDPEGTPHAFKGMAQDFTVE